MQVSFQVSNNKFVWAFFRVLYYAVLGSAIYVMAQELKVDTIIAMIILISTLLIKQLVYIKSTEDKDAKQN